MAEYERRDKEKGQDSAEGSGRKRDGQAGRHAEINSGRGPPGAVTKSQNTMITKRTMSLVTKNFRKLQRPCASMAAPRYIPLTASLNSGRVKLQRRNHHLMPKGR